MSAMEKYLKHFRIEFLEWKKQFSTEVRSISETLKEVVDKQQVSQDDDFVNLQKYEEEVKEKEEENMEDVNREEGHGNDGTEVPMNDVDVEEKQGEEEENKEEEKDKEEEKGNEEVVVDKSNELENNNEEAEKNDEDQPSIGGKCKEDDLQKKKDDSEDDEDGGRGPEDEGPKEVDRNQTHADGGEDQTRAGEDQTRAEETQESKTPMPRPEAADEVYSSLLKISGKLIMISSSDEKPTRHRRAPAVFTPTPAPAVFTRFTRPLRPPSVYPFSYPKDEISEGDIAAMAKWIKVGLKSNHKNA